MSTAQQPPSLVDPSTRSNRRLAAAQRNATRALEKRKEKIVLQSCFHQTPGTELPTGTESAPKAKGLGYPLQVRQEHFISASLKRPRASDRSRVSPWSRLEDRLLNLDDDLPFTGPRLFSISHDSKPCSNVLQLTAEQDSGQTTPRETKSPSVRNILTQECRCRDCLLASTILATKLVGAHLMANKILRICSLANTNVARQPNSFVRPRRSRLDENIASQLTPTNNRGTPCCDDLECRFACFLPWSLDIRPIYAHHMNRWHVRCQ